MSENDGSESLRSIKNARARISLVPPKIDPPVPLAKATFIDLKWQNLLHLKIRVQQTRARSDSVNGEIIAANWTRALAARRPACRRIWGEPPLGTSQTQRVGGSYFRMGGRSAAALSRVSHRALTV